MERHTNQRTRGQAQTCTLDRKGHPRAGAGRQPLAIHHGPCLALVLRWGHLAMSGEGGVSIVTTGRMLLGRTTYSAQDAPRPPSPTPTAPRMRSPAGWPPSSPLAPGSFSTSGLHICCTLSLERSSLFTVHCSIVTFLKPVFAHSPKFPLLKALPKHCTWVSVPLSPPPNWKLSEGRPQGGLSPSWAQAALFSQTYYNGPRDLPGGPVVKTPRAPMQGARVRSLVRELDPACRN